MDTRLLAILVTLLLGVAGFIVTYLNNLRLARRKDRFTLLSQQIGELYGPLYVATQANEISLKQFKSKNGGHIFKNIDYPSEEEVKAWISYFKNTLFPINEAIEKLIINKAHLVIEDGMPIHFQEFISHMVACRLMFQLWDEGKYIDVLPSHSYPDQLAEYAKSTYLLLKNEQLKLYKK